MDWSLRHRGRRSPSHSVSLPPSREPWRFRRSARRPGAERGRIGAREPAAPRPLSLRAAPPAGCGPHTRSQTPPGPTAGHRDGVRGEAVAHQNPAHARRCSTPTDPVADSGTRSRASPAHPWSARRRRWCRGGFRSLGLPTAERNLPSRFATVWCIEVRAAWHVVDQPSAQRFDRLRIGLPEFGGHNDERLPHADPLRTLLFGATQHLRQMGLCLRNGPDLARSGLSHGFTYKCSLV